MKRLTRRRISAIGATFLSVALLATGCSSAAAPATDQPALSKKAVTITLNWWGADQRNQITTKAVKLFEEKYPNITVDLTNADWTGYWDKLATATAGGQPPDVSQFDQLYLASYAKKGALLDLSTVSNTLKTGDLSESILGSGKVQGTLYAIPIGATPEGVLINKSVLKKYDIPLPDFDTWTWTEFNTLAAEITRKSEGAVHGVSPFGGDSFSLAVWARQHGNDVFDKDGKVTLKASVLESYWNQELSWIASKASPSAATLSENTSLTLDQNDMSTGKTAMALVPAGQLSAYQASNPSSEFALANWPTDRASKAGFQYLKPSMYWAVSAKTAHPAESALLVDFLTSDPAAGKILGIDRGVPANPKLQKAITPTLSAIDTENLAFTAAMTKVAGTAPAITPNGASTIEISLTRYNQQVLFKQSTAAAAAAAFIKELQANITNAG